jgi:hypothetical protein
MAMAMGMDTVMVMDIRMIKPMENGGGGFLRVSLKARFKSFVHQYVKL